MVSASWNGTSIGVRSAARFALSTAPPRPCAPPGKRESRDAQTVRLVRVLGLRRESKGARDYVAAMPGALVRPPHGPAPRLREREEAVNRIPALRRCVAEAEAKVVHIKDPLLRLATFEKILDRLLRECITPVRRAPGRGRR